MSTFRFIHTADLHLDSPFKGLHHLPEEIMNEIYQSTYRSFDRIITYCLEKEVDFLLISGDLFDLTNQSIRAQMHLKKGLEILSEKGIYTYIIHGNHDPMDQKNTKLNWPEKVYFFSSASVEDRSFYKNGKEVARILGRSYPTKAFMENITQDFVRTYEDLFHIGLLHTNVDGKENHDPYCPSRLSDLIHSDMDYWALGHVHSSEVLHAQKPYVVYPGNPQGRHIREVGDRGCYLVEVSNLEVQSIDWLSTTQIRWEQFEIDITTVSSVDELIDLVETEINEKRELVKLPIVIRLLLCGQTLVHELLTDDSQIVQIQDVLNTTLSTRQPWSWVESIQRKTKPILSLEQIREQGTFSADYLQQVEQFFQQVNQEYMKKEMIPDLFRHRGIKKHYTTFDEIDFQELKNEIMALVYQYLHEKES